ncbi:hypothetical protein IPU53_24030, partial [Bacillus sp. SD088]|nr:hypothetical protein [Bacillus sp. SD088]
MKKWLYTLMILLVIFQSACSKETEGNQVELGTDENLNKTGMPIVNEPITIKMFVGMAAKTQSNWDDILIWNTYEEMTNVHIDWEV